MKTKIIILMLLVCVIVMTIGCIDEFETEKTVISTTVPTLVPTETDVPTDKEKFIDKYTKAKEAFIYDYGGYELELKANETENLAHIYYLNGQFSKASVKYHSASELYLELGEHGLEVKVLFEEAYKIAPTEYYKELCKLYITATESYTKSMIHMSSAMKHMENHCNYDEVEKYMKEYKAAERDILQYNIELETFYDLCDKIDEIEYLHI